MRISVVIPCYNHAHLVGDAIRSALSQTYPPLEILVVDDGSNKDNPREVVESFPPPVRYLYKPNGGLSSARNFGIHHAAGDWIALLDSDDWWAPEKLARQAASIAATPNAVLSHTSRVLVHDTGRTTVAEAPGPPYWPNIRFRNPIAASSVLVQAQAVRDAGGFNESLRTCEDWDLWVRLGPQRPFVVVPEPLLYYRIIGNSLSHGSVDRMLADTERILEGSLLAGLEGFERWKTRRLIRSSQFLRAAITMRDCHGKGFGRYLWQAFASAPIGPDSRTFYKFLFVTLLRLLRRQPLAVPQDLP
jgi:glycosyltransferase involved in cell wall biosynthesis